MFFYIFKNLKPKEKVALGILMLFGAVSEPIIAYAYILLGQEFSNPNNIKSFDSVLRIVIYIIIALIIAGLNYLGVDILINNVITSIRKKSFRNILNRKASEIVQNERATYYNDVLKKIEIWKFRYLKSAIDGIESSLQILFTIIFICFIDIRIALVIILFLIPLIINNIFFPKKMEKGYAEYLEKDTEQLKRLKEYLDGILVIKNNNEIEWYARKMEKIFDEVNVAWRKTSILANSSAFIANSGVVISRLSGILISLIFYMNQKISIGTFIALTQLTIFISEPVIRLINAVIGMNSVKGMNQDIFKLYHLNKMNEDNILPIKFNALTLDNMNHQYIKGIDVFSNNINFTFQRGKKYLVMGKSGSGKSTLLKILMKYYLDYTGIIRVDGTSLSNISEEMLHANVMYIPQNIFIFNESIRNNIDLKGEYSDEKIIETLREMRLLHLIKDQNLDTKIGQEINALSGGESARLYIVKAKLSSKKIIIADEILSNLDSSNAERVEKLLLSLEGKTLIHIAHHSNPELADKYDGILRLDEV